MSCNVIQKLISQLPSTATSYELPSLCSIFIAELHVSLAAPRITLLFIQTA